MLCPFTHALLTCVTLQETSAPRTLRGVNLVRHGCEAFADNYMHVAEEYV